MQNFGKAKWFVWAALLVLPTNQALAKFPDLRGFINSCRLAVQSDSSANPNKFKKESPFFAGFTNWEKVGEKLVAEAEVPALHGTRGERRTILVKASFALQTQTLDIQLENFPQQEYFIERITQIIIAQIKFENEFDEFVPLIRVEALGPDSVQIFGLPAEKSSFDFLTILAREIFAPFGYRNFISKMTAGQKAAAAGWFSKNFNQQNLSSPLKFEDVLRFPK